MKESRFNVFVEEKDSVLAYNSRSIGFARMSNEDFRVARQLMDGEINPDQNEATRAMYEGLVRGQFLIPDDMDEMQLLKVRNRLSRFAAKGLGMVIAPTLRCNFACEYCYVDLNANKMKREKRQRLKAFFDHKLPSSSSAAICWTGGDPSLAMDVVEDLSQYFIENCEQKGSEYNAVMITNAYLLNQRMVDQIKRSHIRSVQVTLDGYREDHDAHRYLVGKKPTFDRILENVENACEQVHINLRINIDKRNVSNITKLLDDLTERGLNKKLTAYYARVDAMNEMSKDYEEHTFPVEEYPKTEAWLTREMLDRGFAQGKNVLRTVRSTFCGANSNNHFVVDPHCNLLKCYTDFGMADKYGIGYIDEQGRDVIDKPKNLVKWLGWDPFEIEECKSCKVLPLCMGGCSYKVITQGLGMEHACVQLRWSLEETLKVIGDRISAKSGTVGCGIATGGCTV